MTAASITCPKYEAVESSRRCRHYVDNGACARPDELMCVEWLKRNAQSARPTSAKTPAPQASPAAASSEDTPPATTQVLAVRTLTDEALESFRALGIEICLATAEAGSIWIVPEYTQQKREELRVDHAATLAALCSTFPGARVLSFAHLELAERPQPSSARKR